MATESRFYVFDRGATQTRELHRFSAVNPRYWVLDRTTGLSVDECQTKRGAADSARLFNDGTWTP